MSTVREVISRVRSAEKLISSDNSITDRVVMRELKSKAIAFIRQQTDKRRLWQTSTIFTNIPCLEMRQVPTSDCCDYVSDQMVAKSRLQIPKISEGIYGLLIHGVFSVDSGKRIKEVTLSRYINLLRIGLPVKDTYYWFYDRYLYISSPYVKVASIWAYFEEDVPDEVMYPECDCPNQKKKNPCKNPLDDEFKCPGFLEDAVVKDTLKTLMETYFRIPVDNNSNNQDEQVNKR